MHFNSLPSFNIAKITEHHAVIEAEWTMFKAPGIEIRKDPLKSGIFPYLSPCIYTYIIIMYNNV